MKENKIYLFTSHRLGFRDWQALDIPLMASINQDDEVMEFFPAKQSLEETHAFVEKMQQHFAGKGYCYFAVDRLDTGSFIGFIGMMEKTFEAEFNPCIDIGWRLGRDHWNNGFATEGALRCLEYGFETLNIGKILSMAPVVNKKSELVMQKIGMKHIGQFKHPLLKGNDRLEDCVLYEALSDNFRKQTI